MKKNTTSITITNTNPFNKLFITKYGIYSNTSVEKRYIPNNPTNI